MDKYKDGNSLIRNLIFKELKKIREKEDIIIKPEFNEIIEMLIKNILENDKLTESLAKVLWKIHSHSLYPYYVKNKDYEESWNELEEISKPEDVSKSFFREIVKTELKKQI